MSVVAVSGAPVQIWAKGAGSGHIVNLDTVNPLFIAYGTIAPTNSSDVIPPLSSIGLDGSQSVQGSTLNPNITVELQIMGPGVVGRTFTGAPLPLVETTSPVVIELNDVIPAGTTQTLSNPAGGTHLNVAAFQSVIGTLFAQPSGGVLGAEPYYRVRLRGSESDDNFDSLITGDWVCATGPPSFVHNYRHDLTAPTHGDTLGIDVTNYDTKDMSFTIGLFGSYRSRSLELRGRYPDDLTNEAAGLSTDNILLSYQPGPIANGNTATVLIPLYAGDVSISGVLTGETAASTCLIRIQPQPASIIAGQIIVRSVKAGIIDPTSIKLPRRVCTLTIDNTGGAAPVTPNLLITGSSTNH